MSLFDPSLAKQFCSTTTKNKTYVFDPASGLIQTPHSDQTRLILTKIDDDIHKLFGQARKAGLKLSGSVGLIASEVATQMESVDNAGAFFLLPSQLNGAEYPDHETIITDIRDYQSDGTAGPAGQLAVDNSLGQFILDNAQNTNQTGIDCSLFLTSKISRLRSINGYLRVSQSFRDMSGLSDSLGQIVTVGFTSAKVCGFNRHTNRHIKAAHMINVIYGSALPIDSYVNPYTNDMIRKVSQLLLFAEYYGCLKAAIVQSQKTQTVTKVYLLLLGGGVFNNDPVIIIYSIYQALYVIEYVYGSKSRLLRPIILAYQRDPNIDYYRLIQSTVKAYFKKIEKKSC